MKNSVFASEDIELLEISGLEDDFENDSGCTKKELGPIPNDYLNKQMLYLISYGREQTFEFEDFHINLSNQAIKMLNNAFSRDVNLQIEEGINLPNSEAISNTKRIINELIISNHIPDSIRITVEEGISLNFKKGNQMMYFEVYNNGELGYIIEDRIKLRIVNNQDVSTIDQAINVITDFLGIKCDFRIV